MPQRDTLPGPSNVAAPCGFETPESAKGDGHEQAASVLPALTAYGECPTAPRTSLGFAFSGVYGLRAYAVGERRAEFSLRMAVGSTQVRVLRFVLGQGLRLTLVGLAVGCAAALAASRLLQSLLFGVSVTDPLTYLGVAALLLVASLAACGAPAWRAARSDPRSSMG